MYDTLSEVRENKYINNLEQICKSFRVYGRYQTVSNCNNTKFNGVYFVYGLAAHKIFAGINNISSFYEACKMDQYFMRLDVAAIRLTDCSPFATHQRVLDFCRHAEFIREIYKDNNHVVPDKVHQTALLYLKMLYINANNKSLNKKTRDNYGLSLRNYITIEESTRLPDYLSYKKNQFITSGYEDAKKSALQNMWRKTFGKNNNYVSPEQVFFQSDSMCRMPIPPELISPLKKELQKYPDVLFSILKDKNKAYVLCNSLYQNEIEKTMRRINKKDELPVSRANENKIFSLSIPKYSEETFGSICKENNLEYVYAKPYKHERTSSIVNAVFDIKHKDTAIALFNLMSTINTCPPSISKPAKHPSKTRNIADVIKCDSTISHYSIYESDLQKFNDKMKNYPNVIYWVSKPSKGKLKAPKGQGFYELKEDNDLSTVQIAYSASHEPIIDKVIIEMFYPELLRTSPSEMLSSGMYVSSVGVSETDLHNIKSLCNANNVAYCIDLGVPFITDHSLLNVFMGTRDSSMVESIIDRIARESEEFHIYEHHAPTFSIAGNEILTEGTKFIGQRSFTNLQTIISIPQNSTNTNSHSTR